MEDQKFIVFYVFLPIICMFMYNLCNPPYHSSIIFSSIVSSVIVVADFTIGVKIIFFLVTSAIISYKINMSLE